MGLLTGKVLTDSERLEKQKRELQAAIHLAVSDFMKATGLVPKIVLFYEEGHSDHQHPVRDKISWKDSVPRVSVDVHL